MASGAEINSSLGEVNRVEDRSFGRKYKTFGAPINSAEEVLGGYREVLREFKGHSARRMVMRSLMSQDAINAARKYGLPMEAGIPMHLVTGLDDGSAIVYIARNSHDSPRQGSNPREYIKHRGNGRTPLERARQLPEKYKPVNRLEENDGPALFALWERFGWTMDEIHNFIKRTQSGEKNLWFSGIRDKETGRLVVASNAEAIEFAGVRYIETTEYSTDKDYENQGLCTTAVSALIAQVLKDTRYNSADDLIPVITAEFNTSSTSPSVGASAGFVIPQFAGTDGILSYNVAVGDNASPNEVFAGSDLQDRGISYGNLRDFALAVLPIAQIDILYPENAVNEIINFYN